MLTFWRQGYEGSSIRHLVNAMGIHRGSLYDTFGDKRSLFTESLDHYYTTVVANATLDLQHPDATMEAIAAFFDLVVGCSASDPDRKGCLLVNSAVELSARDADIEQQLSIYFYRIERLLARVLERARQTGEIASESDTKLLAKYLVTSLQGLRVAAKQTSDRSTLQAIADVALSALGDRRTWQTR